MSSVGSGLMSQYDESPVDTINRAKLYYIHVFFFSYISTFYLNIVLLYIEIELYAKKGSKLITMFSKSYNNFHFF